MAYGLPCIFSDLPVHREISGGGKAAAIFARGDSESLAQQLLLLLEDEGHRQRYGVAARQLVEQHYSRGLPVNSTFMPSGFEWQFVVTETGNSGISLVFREMCDTAGFPQDCCGPTGLQPKFPFAT